MTAPVPGFYIVNAAIDAGADYLKLNYANAGIGTFSNSFKNTYVFTFTNPIALQITDVLIDPSTTLGLTPDRVTFSDNKLFVNVRDLFFNRNSTARLNLTTVAATEPDPNTVPTSSAAAVPEPGSMLGLSIVALGGAMLKRHTKCRALQ